MTWLLFSKENPHDKKEKDYNVRPGDADAMLISRKRLNPLSRFRNQPIKTNLHPLQAWLIKKDGWIDLLCSIYTLFGPVGPTPKP